MANLNLDMKRWGDKLLIKLNIGVWGPQKSTLWFKEKGSKAVCRGDGCPAGVFQGYNSPQIKFSKM